MKIEQSEEKWEADWNRHTKRRETFEAFGLSEVLAWELAEEMFDRDHDKDDDRRVCFECKYLNKPMQVCMREEGKRLSAPYRFVLGRCASFLIKGTK